MFVIETAVLIQVCYALKAAYLMVMIYKATTR